MLSEFDVIRKFFSRAPRAGNRVSLGVGDDAALVNIAPGHELVAACDMMLVGQHFLADVEPAKLGHKCLAVNLSDMAAMGAVPRWCLLALALPVADEAWLAEFARGFHDLADRYGVDLIGGDTTRGPYTACVQILGEVPAGSALRRDGARVGDDVWVSGTLGDAAIGLAHLRGEVKLDARAASHCLQRLETPQPRVVLGEALRELAHSAIDISDGFAADLGHILNRSRVGAEIEFERLPRSDALIRISDAHGERVRDAVLGGGDDYELCFTAGAGQRTTLAELAHKLGLRLSRVGQIVAGAGLVVRDSHGRNIAPPKTGFDHFAAA
jgi:thiamine-monophosphate kinase